MPRRYRTSSKRSGARSRFRLQAVESVKKCSWECFREGTKSRPVGVRLAGTPPSMAGESMVAPQSWPDLAAMVLRWVQ